MRKFILKTSLFLFLLSISIAFIEIKLGTIPNSYNTKRKQLEAQSDSIQVLILGSSQSLYGINPSYFNMKGYNLSNIGQSLFYDAHITLKYIDKLRALKFVLIEIGDFTLNKQIIDGVEPWRDYFYAQFWGIKYPEIPSTDLKLYSKIALYTPTISRHLLFKKNDSDLVKNYRLNGWAFNETTEGEITDAATMVTFKRHTRLLPKRCKENYEILELLITELEKRNIVPILFTPPVYSIYYNRTNPARDSTAQLISILCKKYNLKYYDYFKDSRFQRTDFNDCDHLNFIGAEKFSRIINNELLNENKKT